MRRDPRAIISRLLEDGDITEEEVQMFAGQLCARVNSFSSHTSSTHNVYQVQFLLLSPTSRLPGTILTSVPNFSTTRYNSYFCPQLLDYQVQFLLLSPTSRLPGTILTSVPNFSTTRYNSYFCPQFLDYQVQFLLLSPTSRLSGTILTSVPNFSTTRYNSYFCPQLLDDETSNPGFDIYIL